MRSGLRGCVALGGADHQLAGDGDAGRKRGAWTVADPAAWSPDNRLRLRMADGKESAPEQHRSRPGAICHAMMRPRCDASSA